MPHSCVHCSKVYEDGSEEVLNGCSSCGGRFFFYLTKEKLDKINKEKDEKIELSKEEKDQIEKDVRDITGIEEDKAPIVMDLESVKVLKPGQYILDIANLFSKERPLIYKLEDGKYVVDLAASFKRAGKDT